MILLSKAGRFFSTVINLFSYLPTSPRLEIFATIQMVVDETVHSSDGRKRKRTHEELDKWLRSYCIEIVESSDSDDEKDFGNEMGRGKPNNEAEEEEKSLWRPPPLYRRDGTVIRPPESLGDCRKNYQANKNANNHRKDTLDADIKPQSVEKETSDCAGVVTPVTPPTTTPTTPSNSSVSTPTTPPSSPRDRDVDADGDHDCIYKPMPLSPRRTSTAKPPKVEKRGDQESDGESDSESGLKEESRERRRLLLQKISSLAQKTKTARGRAEQVRSMSEWKAVMNLHTIYDQQQAQRQAREEKHPRTELREDIRERNRQRLRALQRSSEISLSVLKRVRLLPSPSQKKTKK